jgi:hypothetical protein
MAFVSRGIGDSDSDINSGRLSTGSSGFVRWFAVPIAMAVLASWGMATLAGLHSAASLAYARSYAPASLSGASLSGASLSGAGLPAQFARLTSRQMPIRKAPAVQVEKSARLVSAQTAMAAAPAEEPSENPFGKIVAEAKLSREKLLGAFARAGMTISDAGIEEAVEVAAVEPVAARFHGVAMAMPRADRFGAEPAASARVDIDPLSSLALGQTGIEAELAYAPVEPGADDLIQVALASLGDDGMDAEMDIEEREEMPDSALLPAHKPDAKPARPEREPAEVPDEPAARKPAKPDKQEPQQALAYARPDKPAVGVFKNLFNTPKAGKGVAIYDISAAVVHMPDGSKLEAHSGIGKMADNPRYVHVKMNGPTPPNTYKLSMREKRFHGVEAVRMTPIGDEKMHGRTGILAHSYLLRGGREESHGCVAFKDYPRFLKAFKQGKVTHIVVVPSMSRMPKVRLAAMGRGA